ncbi:hypothetical protein MC81_14190 [Achromobacter insolitus]|uniref:Lysozyme n=1 Tax=Achromobacter insolitus TaxID=217204 RepID=A0A6S7FBA0_9BURK|nr:hypothetical protein MC81_14190 [Achromobacter insolitus]CAB3933683.1 hypothetical protein LMG6000_03361 [Achromobacter insolitus]CAB3937527.1 hypothetical protein LMG5997_03272 [Achromobacter insolitus]
MLSSLHLKLYLATLATLIAQQPAYALDATPAEAATATSAAALGLIDLTDDLSRKDLFNEILKIDAAAGSVDPAQYFNLYNAFRFPDDVKVDAVLRTPRTNSLFGVDISHHTHSAFPIEQLRKREVHFVYMKATQGARFLDPKFSTFWSRAGKLPKGSEVHRGAYHFLSSGDGKTPPEEWGRAQGRTFVKVIKANGGLLETDMPPVVDLEWDKESSGSKDRWIDRKPDEIIKILTAFLVTVETELGRRPMIYTTRSWWNERIGSEKKMESLSQYPLWIADYSKTSQANETPRTINGSKWALWQYTDSAKMAIGFNDAFDANIFKGEPATFYTTLSVKAFQ